MKKKIAAALSVCVVLLLALLWAMNPFTDHAEQTMQNDSSQANAKQHYESENADGTQSMEQYDESDTSSLYIPNSKSFE